MIIIDKNKCTGCGLCVSDCFRRSLRIVQNKARTVSGNCNRCGHCVAICPAEAVAFDDCDMSEVTKTASAPFKPDELLSFIKSRRSIRQFKHRPVEREKLIKIIEAGRYTPTGGNVQGLSYIVVQEELEHFRRLVIPALGELGRSMLADDAASDRFKSYAQLWVRMAEDFALNPDCEDMLFFKAPTVILIVGQSILDAGLAASNMELMVIAQGLGMLYSGFITRACVNAKIREFLDIPSDGRCSLRWWWAIRRLNTGAPRRATRRK